MPPAPRRLRSCSCGNSFASSSTGGGSKRPAPGSPPSVSAPCASRQEGHKPASAPAGIGFPQLGHGFTSFTLGLIGLVVLCPPQKRFRRSVTAKFKKLAVPGKNSYQER